MIVRRFKLFFIDNKMWLIIIAIVFGLIFLSIFGLCALDSFYRTLTLASIPINLLISFASTAVFVFMYLIFFTKYGFEKLKKNKIRASDIKVSLDDVIGLETAKKEALEVVNLIKDRKQIQKIGGSIIRGILLMGPPGCGKTLLAKAIATECKIPFLSMSGSEFVEMFVGVGASRIRALFRKARRYAYTNGACIVFIDEIEVIGRERTYSRFSGREENSTQNQLLVEMDGLDNKKNNVIVIAATNANENILDEALLRSGRFDRKIDIEFPNLKERKELFKFYFKKMKITTDVKIDKLAQKTLYDSPADIENIVREAALIAMRKHGDPLIVDMKDFSEALDRISLGIESNLDMTPKELEITSYHEAGHAVAIYLLHPTDDVFKVTVKSRRGILGFVAPIPKEELHSEDREEMIADIMVSLAGYAAEKIKYNTTTNGVSSDFRSAMITANNMVWKLGMGSDGFIGDFSSIPGEAVSQSIKEKLNDETIMIINSCYLKIEQFLRTNWNAVEAIVRKLIVKKELDFDELEEVMRIVEEGKDKISK